MKWITLNDGNLVNLEKISYICISNRSTKHSTISYYGDTDVATVEVFEDSVEANERLAYLRKLLTEENKPWES